MVTAPSRQTPSHGEKDLYDVVKTHLVKAGMEIQLLCKYFNTKCKSFNETTELPVSSSALLLPSLQDTSWPND